MAREIDVRDANTYVRFSVGPADLPVGAVAKQGTLLDQALSVARFITEVFGAEAGKAVDLVPDPEAQPTGSGARTVFLQQHHRGIPVFRSSQTVRFSPAGDPEGSEIHLASGKTLPEIEFGVSSDHAVRIAAEHVCAPTEETGVDYGFETAPPVDLTGFIPTILASFPGLQAMPVVYASGPFAEPIKVNLVWFPLAARLQLAWEVAIALPNFEEIFLSIVSAGDGEMLFCKPLTSAADCRGRVFRTNPSSPREMVDFPLPWSSYGLPVPSDLPDKPISWVTANNTRGPLADCFANDTLQPVAGSNLDRVLTFDPVDQGGLDQLVLNGFFGVCFMHDYTYLLGFREANGSYQEGAVSATGLPSQRVRVSVLSGPLGNTAQWVPVQKPMIRLGRKTSTNRHSALDVTLVFHEYTHGLCSRLVGAAREVTPLTATQSRGMNEGWSDYFACMVTGKSVFGGWIAEDETKGLRRFAYDESFPVDKANFGHIENMKIYDIGEMWCATLLDMTRQIGAELGLRLVVDGMKALLADPNVIQGRNAILAEVDDMHRAGQLTSGSHSSTKAAIWAAFAKFGMGLRARSDDAELFGTVSDTAVP
jgi:extracellular elastinolytic metalloproteinase